VQIQVTDLVGPFWQFGKFNAIAARKTDWVGTSPELTPHTMHLTKLDRGRAAATFDQKAQSIAGYEASAEVTTFTSKFDAVQAGKAQCNACHRDGGARW
jgi:hypothetical protein